MQTSLKELITAKPAIHSDGEAWKWLYNLVGSGAKLLFCFVFVFLGERMLDVKVLIIEKFKYIKIEKIL